MTASSNPQRHHRGEIVSGGVWAFWVGFKASAAAPSSALSAPVR